MGLAPLLEFEFSDFFSDERKTSDSDEKSKKARKNISPTRLTAQHVLSGAHWLRPQPKSLWPRAHHIWSFVAASLFFFGRSRPIDTRINYNPNLWAKKHRQARNLPQIIDQQQPKLSYAWKFLNATWRGQKRDIERHTTGRRIIYEIKFIILRLAEAAARLSETLSARIYVHSILRRVWFQLVGRRRRRRHQCRSRRVINKQKKKEQHRVEEEEEKKLITAVTCESVVLCCWFWCCFRLSNSSFFRW